MSNEEYTTELAAIDERAEKDKRLLISRFARENRKFKDTDTIKDHIGSGVVLRLRVQRGFGSKIPDIFYECHELKKDGTLKFDKKGNKVMRPIFETNVTNQ